MKNLPKYCAPVFCAMLITLSSSSSMARCEMDKPPAIPQNMNISLNEIKAVKIKVDAYMNTGNHFLRCQHREKRLDEAVRQMKIVAANFNAMVMTYKDNLSEQQAKASEQQATVSEQQTKDLQLTAK